jgi:hypothetical protein
MPPPSALETPPEAVCFNRAAHSLVPCEFALLSLEGEPKLIPLGCPVALKEIRRRSADGPGFMGLDERIDFAKLEALAGEASGASVPPSLVAPGNRANNFARLLLVFTLVLRNLLLFEELYGFHTSCFQRHRATRAQSLPGPINLEKAKAFGCYQ